jgi:hypothetical protein
MLMEPDSAAYLGSVDRDVQLLRDGISARFRWRRGRFAIDAITDSTSRQPFVQPVDGRNVVGLKSTNSNGHC